MNGLQDSPSGNGEQEWRNKNQARPAILFSSMTSKPALRKAWFEAKFCAGEMASTMRTPNSRPARSADKRNSGSVKTSTPIGWRDRKVHLCRIGISTIVANLTNGYVAPLKNPEPCGW